MSNDKLNGLTVAEVREVLSVDELGNLTWLVSRGSKAVAGGKAGTLTDKGYVDVKCNGRNIRGHHIVWALTYGEWADGEIDHINGIRNDNRPSNLRLSTRAGNCQNAGMRKDNKSGVKGVYFHRPTGKWAAAIRSCGKRNHIGLFVNLGDAAKAVKKAREALHSDFANHGQDFKEQSDGQEQRA